MLICIGSWMRCQGVEAVRKTEGDNIKEEKDTRWHSVTIQYILIREFSEEVRRIIGGGAMGFPLILNPPEHLDISWLGQ